MSLIATAKNKAAKGSVAAAFKNEAGAIDLASIMVGIIVIGLIGGVIAATVFSVIPWAQDNAAKQQLDSIAAAQSASIGQSADGGAISFAPLGAANVNGTLANEGLLPASVKAKVAVQGTGSSAHYAAVVASASGKYFYISDTKTQATEAGSSGAAAASVFTGSTTGTNSSINGVVYNGISWTGSF